MKIIIVILFIILFLSLLISGISYFFILFSLDFKSKVNMFNIKTKKTESNFLVEPKVQIYNKWIEENCKSVTTFSFDGLKLQGYLLENPHSSDYVILPHGFGSSPAEMYTIGMNYKDWGFNVLFIQHRGRGKSEGRYCTMAVNESKDVKSWCEFVTKLNSEGKIILHGISMGAASIMNSLKYNLPSNVKALVEDCGFTGTWDIFEFFTKRYYHLPVVPFLYLNSFMAKKLLHINYKDCNCLSAVENSCLPILFIHGKSDAIVPFWMEEKLYNVAKGPKEQFIVEEANHTQARKLQPSLYYQTVEKFVKKYI